MSMNANLSRPVGAAILVLGVVLLVFAFNASNAPVDQIANSLTGRYTDQTMMYLLSGIAAAVIGAGLLFSGRRFF